MGANKLTQCSRMLILNKHAKTGSSSSFSCLSAAKLAKEKAYIN